MKRRSTVNAQRGHKVTFRLPNGHLENGIVVAVDYSGLLIGVQNNQKLMVPGHRTSWHNGKQWVVKTLVPNNSLWVVPYSHVVQVGEWVSDQEQREAVVVTT